MSPELHEYLYPKQSSDDEIVEETLTFYKSTNRLIQKEIDALRSHVQEAEQDMATLKDNNIQAIPDSISGQKTLEDTPYEECEFDLAADMVGRDQSENPDDDHLRNQIKDLSKDILNTKKEMKKLKCDEECYKEQVDIVNQIFLCLLSSNNDGVKIQSDYEAYCDLERTFADSCKLTRDLEEELQYSTKTKGRRKGETVKTPSIQRIIGAHESYSYGLFSIGQIERILKILKREKKYLDEPNLQIWFEFLEKLAVVLLQKLIDKTLLLKNQEQKGTTLEKRIDCLKNSRCLENSDKDTMALDSSTKHECYPSQSLQGDDLKVDFEQPISLINPNYIPPSDQI